MVLGCIADDFTGATDLADTLVRSGMRTLQMNGVPDKMVEGVDADAVVIALKCRTIPADAAIEQALHALRWLQNAGCRQFFWKYCSTFDSTAQGNIGPVADALLTHLMGDLTLVCPAFPTNKRTVYKGYLFVGDVPLHESSMRHHPLTPMTDSNLLRLLQAQVNGQVGLVPWETVRQGPAKIRAALNTLSAQGVRFAIVDALEDDDLRTIGAACATLPLITGGSGIAIGLPENFRQQGVLPGRKDAGKLPKIPGPCAILAGSCSAATLQQIALAKKQIPAYRLDPLYLAGHPQEGIEPVLAWVRQHKRRSPVLIYSSSEPKELATIQHTLGRERASRLIEHTFAEIARRLRANGITRFIVAGGETSGAVVKALGIQALRIGPRIDPGVPWTCTLDPEPIALALKSGNFGTPDFFCKALESLA